MSYRKLLVIKLKRNSGRTLRVGTAPLFAAQEIVETLTCSTLYEVGVLKLDEEASRQFFVLPGLVLQLTVLLRRWDGLTLCQS